jgi:hypothetical protein
METIVVYAPQTSTRLKFVSDWLFKERLQLDYKIVTNLAEAAMHPFVIAYGHVLPGAISIPDCGLLFATGIHKQEVASGTWQDIPTIFANETKDFSLPFDLFSAIFYLLSRYEEYYPYKPDKHGRYPATASILYKKSLLLRPVADEWVHAFGKLLHKQLKIAIRPTNFAYQPTYDIDMAYSHLYKGVKRIIGAYIRSLLKVDLKQITERTQVLKHKQKDPYDSFRWLRQLHKEYGCKPIYFILSAFKTTSYDKNIHPRHPAMARVIRNLAKEGIVGIHPSYYSADGGLMNEEKKTLEQIAGKPAPISRQHYIRVKTPDTYRLLLKNGITDDYTMGYGAKLGFRAGTGNSFPWYDLLIEQTTQLRIHPFCFMDTTAFYELKMTTAEAFATLDAMSKQLEKTGSTLITVFHNFSLGTSSEWKGWRNAYEHFMQEKTHRSHGHTASAPDTI